MDDQFHLKLAIIGEFAIIIVIVIVTIITMTMTIDQIESNFRYQGPKIIDFIVFIVIGFTIPK